MLDIIPHSTRDAVDCLASALHAPLNKERIKTPKTTAFLHQHYATLTSQDNPFPRNPATSISTNFPQILQK